MGTLRKLGPAVLLMMALFGSIESLAAQACSCGGAPMLGALGSAPPSLGQWQLDSQYDYNDISGLASGSSTLAPNGRRQLSQSTIVRLNYGLSRSVTLSFLVTAVAKERAVSDVVKTAGIGDGIMLLQVNLLPELSYPQRDLMVGVGFKAPLGAADLRRNGVRISPDMQPTTGGWDGLFSLYYMAEILPPLPMSLLLTASRRWTSANPNYSITQDDYRFGNETVVSMGLRYGLSLRSLVNLQLNYRRTDADQIGTYELPNSGGQWLFAALGFNWALLENLGLGVSGQLPIYHQLNGAIQLTTRYSFSLFVNYTFGGRKGMGDS